MERATLLAALEIWMAWNRGNIEARHLRECPALTPPTLSYMEGPRYFRIVKSIPGSSSAFAFIDKATGDILKPASWKSPAKHARGNLFDAHAGTGAMSEYGPAYLR